MESKTAAASASAVAARVESLGGAGVARRLGLDDISSWFLRVCVDGGRAGKRSLQSSARFELRPTEQLLNSCKNGPRIRRRLEVGRRCWAGLAEAVDSENFHEFSGFFSQNVVVLKYYQISIPVNRNQDHYGMSLLK
jgi:hypothetical protein